MRPRDSRGSGAEWRGFARVHRTNVVTGTRVRGRRAAGSATGACDAAGRREKARETWGAGRVWRSETLLTPRGPRLALSGSQSLAPPRGVALPVSSRSTKSKNTCSLIRRSMIYNRNDNVLVGRDHTFAARGRVVEMGRCACGLWRAADSATQQAESWDGARCRACVRDASAQERLATPRKWRPEPMPPAPGGGRGATSDSQL